MRRECRERFPRHRLPVKPRVSDPSMHHGTCVTCATCSRKPHGCKFYILTNIYQPPAYLNHIYETVKQTSCGMIEIIVIIVVRLPIHPGLKPPHAIQRTVWWVSWEVLQGYTGRVVQAVVKTVICGWHGICVDNRIHGHLHSVYLVPDNGPWNFNTWLMWTRDVYQNIYEIQYTPNNLRRYSLLTTKFVNKYVHFYSVRWLQYISIIEMY